MDEPAGRSSCTSPGWPVADEKRCLVADASDVEEGARGSSEQGLASTWKNSGVV